MPRSGRWQGAIGQLRQEKYFLYLLFLYFTHYVDKNFLFYLLYQDIISTEGESLAWYNVHSAPSIGTNIKPKANWESDKSMLPKM